jgi:hypothetical protein
MLENVMILKIDISQNNIIIKEMNRKILAILFVFLGIGISCQIFGQNYYCGTIPSDEQVFLEQSITIAQGLPTASLPLLNRTLSISVFIVKDGPVHIFNTTLVYDAVNALNDYFSPIGLKFSICKVDTVANYQFDRLDMNNTGNNNDEKDLVIQNYVPQTINLYLVYSMSDAKGPYVIGQSSMPADAGKNCVFIRKDYIFKTELAHQIGHFLGLYHTYETKFGPELVDGTNCTIAGDRCCDTPAEPDAVAFKNCIYTGKAKDKNGKIYGPSPKNMMTTDDDCRCVFSKTQFLRMAYMLQTYRKDLR